MLVQFYLLQVRTYFRDPSFIPGISAERQKWLPKIPPTGEEDFKDLTVSSESLTDRKMNI